MQTSLPSSLRAPHVEAISLVTFALLPPFDEKRKDRWSEAVNNIDFTHSSRLAWNIINNLTGKIKHPRRLCPVAANTIAL